MSLNPGDPAPDFSLPDATGTLVNLSDFHGKRVILYFYPRDNTPGCTTQACSFRDAYGDFQSQDVVILGVSTDDAKSHTKFTTKYQLPFPLLTDAEGTIATAYESYGLKKFMGREFMGIFRNTFVISPDGTIEKIYSKVKPELHIAQVLQDLQAIQSSSD